MNGERSKLRLVHHPVEIKTWISQTPDVDEARPKRCPACGLGSRPPGAGLQIHGHGLRCRQIRGPASPDSPPETREIKLRRYRCLRCEAVIAVGPMGLLRGWLYSAPAIAWALALYGIGKQAAARVRSRVSPWSIVGPAAAGNWATLRHWLRAVVARRLFAEVRPCPPDWRPKQIAERAATTLIAAAPSGDLALPLAHQAWLGAAQLGRAIAM